MPRVVVDVMLKSEILDPQGQAVQGALGRLGVAGVTQRPPRQAVRDRVRRCDGRRQDSTQIASTLLANTVIEDYSVRVEDA